MRAPPGQVSLNPLPGDPDLLSPAPELKVRRLDMVDSSAVTDLTFSEVAEHINVCSLGICGKIDSRVLSPKTLYAAFLIFQTADTSFGLNFPKQEASVKVGSHVSSHEVCLELDKDATKRMQATTTYHALWPGFVAFPSPEEENLGMSKAPCARNDGWFEVELGEFFNDDGEDGDVDMSVMEVKTGYWKTGIIIFGMEIRPKKLAHMELDKA